MIAPQSVARFCTADAGNFKKGLLALLITRMIAARFDSVTHFRYDVCRVVDFNTQETG
jgi:hypothetical protein